MDDGFNEDKEEDVARIILKQQQKELKERQEEQEEYMENVYDLHKYTTDPALTKTYPEIDEMNKLWTLGNYSPKDEKIILMIDSLMSDLDMLLPNKLRSKIKVAFVRDIHAVILTGRGRKGFAAKLLVTQIGATKAEISGLNKGSGMFSFKGRK